MSYQVIARKWRPQTFDKVVGQQAVTRTLRNALASGRLAQAFVFAGPRGVGKTTTARILARALSCVHGPTADPCGKCEPCVEIADARDMDVLEIDAATHTGIDNIREVIISGLGIMPVRNRYKVFIIDEVHQLSGASFNALLKSIEEPPPHVVFMMATTELDKIPETVLSRSQVYEFRTISTKIIADTLRHIVDEEGIGVGEDSLQLIARDAEGSMRDAQSKLDQVLAFTGKTITAEDVATVLGLVGRDLLLDTVEAVADEDAPASFALVARAVEMGYDLRAVCRELSRVLRDLLVLTVDPSRINDPEIAGEGERDRLKRLAGRFSREDLLRAFDLTTRAEADIRSAAQPRYHLEMALLRWMHLRKLVSIEDLIASAGAGPSVGRALPERPPASRTAPTAPVAPVAPSAPAFPRPEPFPAPASSVPASTFKDALLAEIKKSKPVFYNMAVAQAQKIEVAGDRVTFTFSPAQRALRDGFEQNHAWLEALAQQVAGRRIAVAAVQAAQGAAAEPPAAVGAPPVADQQAADKKSALRQQALADAGVQTMLDVFPAEIRDVEEM
jgi:DNA polymerase III subunit gamma/tau